MAAPLLKAEIEINAPVSKVWSLVFSDVSGCRSGTRCRICKALGPIRPEPGR